MSAVISFSSSQPQNLAGTEETALILKTKEKEVVRIGFPL